MGKEGTAKRLERKRQPVKDKQKALVLGHQRGVVKIIPAELLPTAVTEGLVFVLQIAMASRADGKGCAEMIEGKMLSVVSDLRSDAVGEFFIRRGKPQQFVGRTVERNAELFQRIDGRGGFAAGDGTKISGAEMAKFRGGFVGKITAAADAENGGRKFLGEHEEPSPSV